MRNKNQLKKKFTQKLESYICNYCLRLYKKELRRSNTVLTNYSEIQMFAYKKDYERVLENYS